ncbi:MAG: hypothetical protein EPO01_20075 [Aquabacterium sp.]|nr:MAG: hypothetical protein EPO01_20075 [Aquabacterium sp.]
MPEITLYASSRPIPASPCVREPHPAGRCRHRARSRTAARADRKPDRDALIAATALVHGLSVVTRNTANFLPTGVPIVNPWP